MAFGGNWPFHLLHLVDLPIHLSQDNLEDPEHCGGEQHQIKPYVKMSLYFAPPLDSYIASVTNVRRETVYCLPVALVVLFLQHPLSLL